MAAGRKRRPNSIPYEYKGFTLDEFQQQAIWYLQRNTSVLVSAPTGTGKTLIADFLVEMAINDNQRLVYTAPIKALVNQKYREFSRHYGGQSIGIVTGDVSHKQDAPVVVMTTEILRNMLITNDHRLAGTGWVVFDEIHYLNHPERGTVWEEAILFLPQDIHILGLSATIPNAKEIGAWIESIHQPMAIVNHQERAVPLHHMYFNNHCQAVECHAFLHAMAEAPTLGVDTKGGTLRPQEIAIDRRLAIRSSRSEQTSHLDLVNYVARNGLFPCLYFVFSREGCEAKAKELASFANYLSSRQKEAVRVTVRRALSSAGLTSHDIPRYETWYKQWQRGIGVHHAGLLPFVREVTENLLERRLLKVIYTTETFAVGVNMPVRTVCFDTLLKHDGQRLRPLAQQEYFQMAGRAGRRGQDRQGTVISRIDQIHPGKLPIWDEQKLEPIESRISISFNLVVNLLARFSTNQIEALLSSTLASFQEKGTSGQTRGFSDLVADFQEKADLLEQLGYVRGHLVLPKGHICRKVYVQEILVTELITSGLIAELQPAELAGLAATIVHSPRSDDPQTTLAPPKWMPAIDLIHEKLRRVDSKLADPKALYPPIAWPITAWAKGVGLANIMKEYPLAPGDLVSVCRQSIDLLRQIMAASQLDTVCSHIREAITMLDRGVVRVNMD